MIKVGIVGLGFMAATHLKAYRKLPRVRVGALCSPSGKRLNGDFSDVSGNLDTGDPMRLDMAFIKPYRLYSDLLADPEIDVIDICAPTPAHADLAIAALRAGKHVICEKPLARTVTAAREIAAAAATAPGYFMPAMCLRFWPDWAWLQQAIASGEFGAVRDARFRRVAQPPAWGQNSYFNGGDSGGALFDLHIHDTDFVQFCFGRPTAVFAAGYSKLSGAVDHVVTHYRVASGAVVHAEGSWAMTEGFGFNMAYTVNFERGTADYDLARGPEALRLYEPGRAGRTITCPPGDGYQGELAYFLNCVREKTAPQVVTAADGLAAVEICAAEEESVRTGSLVAV